MESGIYASLAKCGESRFCDMAESVHVVGEVTVLHKEQKVRVVIARSGETHGNLLVGES